VRISLAQINTIVGDFDRNLELMLDRMREARAQGAELVVFPELALSGYPPKDLLEKRSFIGKNLECLHRFKREVRGIGAILGFIARNEEETGKPLYNSAALVSEGRILHVTHKCLLPTYDVCDEARYFAPCPRSKGVFLFRGKRIALTICEDFWNDADLFPHRLYRYDPVEDLANQGTDLFININASPFTIDKPDFRRKLAVHAARKYAAPVFMVNQVGGYDDIIFDGNSLAVDETGQLLTQALDFQEDLVTVDLETGEGPRREVATDRNERAWRALVLGTRDYTRKCGFSKVVIGLSGGIDSALVACIAVEALGRENVLGVAMPSRFSSASSITDAQALAANLGIRLEDVPMGDSSDGFLRCLRPLFGDRPFDTAEENLQARIRGNILLALSNKFGCMVLSTGNKSELAVGYATLYGDMCGGLAVISDLLKTHVYDLCRFINRNGEIIPQSTMEKPPSAELRPNQTDQDDLPPYEVLDAVLEQYVEEQCGMQEIVDQGFGEDLVRRIVQMVDRNEYKRRQAAPGLKITGKAFGYGRRLPIVHRFAY